MKNVRITLQQLIDRKDDAEAIYRIANKYNLELVNAHRKTELSIDDIDEQEQIYYNYGEWIMDFSGDEKNVKRFVEEIIVKSED